MDPDFERWIASPTDQTYDEWVADSVLRHQAAAVAGMVLPSDLKCIKQVCSSVARAGSGYCEFHRPVPSHSVREPVFPFEWLPLVRQVCTFAAFTLLMFLGSQLGVIEPGPAVVQQAVIASLVFGVFARVCRSYL